MDRFAMKISDRIMRQGDRILPAVPGEVLNDEVIRQLYDLDPVLVVLIHRQEAWN